MTFSRVLLICQEGETDRGRQCGEGLGGHRKFLKPGSITWERKIRGGEGNKREGSYRARGMDKRSVGVQN